MRRPWPFAQSPSGGRLACSTHRRGAASKTSRSRGRASPDRFRERLLCLAALLWLPACATSAVERKSEEPRAQSVPGAGVYVWDATRGWIQPERGSWGSPDHLRAESFRAFQAGAYADALAGFRALKDRGAVDSTAASSEPRKTGDDVNFFIAECYFNLGHYEDALEHYRLVYRQDFPAQNLLDQALQRVFTIGMAYLRGEVPCDFLGIVRFRCPDHGVEILAGPAEGLITEYPTVSFADDAEIEIAKYYFESGEYPEAVPVYDRVAARPDSEWADRANYQGALATFRQVRGVDYDQRTIQEAERRFRRYLENYPRGNHAEAAREKLREISEMEGAKNLRIAKFYLRESQPDACAIYLREVLVNYPTSSSAREAREIQKQLDRINEGS